MQLQDANTCIPWCVYGPFLFFKAIIFLKSYGRDYSDWALKSITLVPGVECINALVHFFEIFFPRVLILWTLNKEEVPAYLYIGNLGHREFRCLIPFIFITFWWILRKKQHIDAASSPTNTDLGALLLDSHKASFNRVKNNKKCEKSLQIENNLLNICLTWILNFICRNNSSVQAFTSTQFR